MTVKASQFRQNLFQLLDSLRESGETLILERGQDRFLLQPLERRKPLGSVDPRPWILPDPQGLEDFSPSKWVPDDLS